MSILCLGQEFGNDPAVHVTKGVTEKTAMCGHHPVNILVTGIDENEYLCYDCTEALDACDEAAFLIATLGDVEPDECS
jgi:polyferredoxin